MKRWKSYEKNLTSYLSKRYPQLLFQRMGGSSSRDNDIRVYLEAKHIFSIEAKYLPSQCGQITLKETTKGFIFSKKSHQNMMPSTQTIIDTINNGEILYENDPRLFNWVQNYYKQKGVAYFGVSRFYKKLHDHPVYICKTEDLTEFVNIKVTLRRKKSGSRHLPQKLLKKAEFLVTSKLKDAVCFVEGFKNKRLYVNCQKEPTELYLSPSLYLSKKENNLYEVRKLSSTKNWSLTFSMSLKKHPAQSSSLL